MTGIQEIVERVSARYDEQSSFEQWRSQLADANECEMIRRWFELADNRCD